MFNITSARNKTHILHRKQAEFLFIGVVVTVGEENIFQVILGVAVGVPVRVWI